jgi:hypothetical protein
MTVAELGGNLKLCSAMRQTPANLELVFGTEWNRFGFLGSCK